jgi:hypothetical protein
MMTYKTELMCSELKAWLESLPRGMSYQEVWEKCDNPAWMFWLIGQTTESAAWSEERKPLVACVLEIIDPENKSLIPIRDWLAGEEADVYAAYAAAAAYSTATFALAAYSTAAAAIATYAATAAIATCACAYASADVIRKHFPICPIGGML